MRKIAIPVFENRISNRLDCSEKIIVYSVEKNKIESREIMHLAQATHSIKLNMILELEIDVLICNGITDFYSRKLGESKVQVMSWISGEVEEVINQYLNGKLLPFKSQGRAKVIKNMETAREHNK